MGQQRRHAFISGRSAASKWNPQVGTFFGLEPEVGAITDATTYFRSKLQFEINAMDVHTGLPAGEFVLVDTRRNARGGVFMRPGCNGPPVETSDGAAPAPADPLVTAD